MNNQAPAPRRVLLKLSGEALLDQESQNPLSAKTLVRVGSEIAAALKTRSLGLGLVIGGGNIFRGLKGQESLGLARTTADRMGMLATLINSLALRDSLRAQGLKAELFSALEVEGLASKVEPDQVELVLARGGVAIFAGGTGNPYFTTDTAAALRAAEIGAETLLKATRVDGVYSADPLKDPEATRYQRLSYSEVIERRLGVMDLTAFSFCMDNSIPICVFSMLEEGGITKALLGDSAGTIIGGKEEEDANL